MCVFCRVYNQEEVGVRRWLLQRLYGFFHFLFHKLLVIPWPQAVVGDLLPHLRSVPWANMF